MNSNLSYIAFDEIGITVAVIASAMAFILLVWNVVKAIHDWRMMARKPTSDRIEDHERRIKNLEECCDEVRGKLQADRKWQQAAAEKDELMLRSIKQLLKHSVGSNDTTELEEMESEIDDYLIKHQSR